MVLSLKSFIINKLDKQDQMAVRSKAPQTDHAWFKPNVGFGMVIIAYHHMHNMDYIFCVNNINFNNKPEFINK